MKRALAAILALAVLGAGAGLVFAYARLSRGRPQREGRAALPGLAAPVEVRWDRWGVPYVRAERAEDLAAALGWLHANDRLDTLEMGRRACTGRLAEVVGPEALAVDIEMRTLRLRETAEQTWKVTSAESRGWLEAYARGVNAWLAARSGDLPPVLTLLGIDPHPWVPADSLCFSLLMAEDLSFWQDRPEEARFRWLGRLGADRLADLLGESGLHVPGEILALAGALPAAAAGPAGPAAAPGSNNWALGPSRSAEGPALVANDPHLGFRLPGVWYQAHLRAPGLEVGGMTLPGAPAVVIGQSAELAWALTNVMLDDHDVFFERLDATRARVERGEGWAPVERRTEAIPVKGGPEHSLELAATDRGPLLPAEPDLGLPPRSLAWTAHEPADAIAAFLHLARTRTAVEVPAGIGGFVGPAQNLVVADRDGHLLYTVLGRLPRRRLGSGRLPSPGWDPAYGWEGLLPAEENPRVLDPGDGMLVTANQDLRQLGHGPALVADYDLPARASRIRELLAGRPLWSAADLAPVQADRRSAYAREVVSLLGGPYTGAAARAAGALAAWDGTMDVRGAAALFALAERRLVEAIFGDDLPVAEASGQDRREWLLRALRGEMRFDWFDDAETPAVEGRSEAMAAGLAAAWREGAARWGEEVARWDYGELHPFELAHPLGGLPLVGRRLFNLGPVPVAGSATTVAAFGGDFKGDRAPVSYGPSMRWVAVVGQGDKSLAVLPSGQAGHPLDSHYRDQWSLYLEGRLRPTAFSEAAIEAAAVSRLTLVP